MDLLDPHRPWDRPRSMQSDLQTLDLLTFLDQVHATLPSMDANSNVQCPLKISSTQLYFLFCFLLVLLFSFSFEWTNEVDLVIPYITVFWLNILCGFNASCGWCDSGTGASRRYRYIYTDCFLLILDTWVLRHPPPSPITFLLFLVFPFVKQL